jgi:hypothetical protein
MPQIPTIKQGVRARPEQFGALVFTNRTPILSLNKDSYLIWSTIDGVKTVELIIQTLKDQHPEIEIEEDTIRDFMRACENLDLIALK